MKKIILSLLFITALTQVKADEIKQIAEKYRNWIVGNEQIDYSNSIVQTRYQSILNYIDDANSKFDNFVFTPEEPFDFSNKPNQKEARTIFAEILFPLSLAYHLPGDPNNPNLHYKNKDTKAKLLKLFTYLRTKGWKDGINMEYKNMDSYKETGVVGFGGSMGNNFLGYSLSLFLNKELLQEEGLLDDELKTLNWISNVVGPQYDFPKLWEVTGYNADGIRSMFNNRLCYVLSLPQNHEERENEAKYFSRLFNKSLQISDGWADLIKSDYMGYHHKNAYLSAYAPNAYHTASLMTYLLNGTSLQVDDLAIENLSKAILTTRIYSNKYDCPRASAGRFPDNLGVLVRNLPCFAYMAEVSSDFKDEMESAFMRLWDPSYEYFTPNYLQSVNCKIMYHGSIGAIQAAVNLSEKNITAENDPKGFWFYPYGGLGIYRNHNWLLSFKGNSKYIWDFESSKTENLYGRFASAGALRILAGGNPISSDGSGYKIDGWDWTRLPNATTLNMPYEELQSKKTRNFSIESYLGGIALDEKAGFVSMKYRAPLNSLFLNKSFFFFEDFVVAMGSNIQAPEDNYSVQTTLYQNGIEDFQISTTVNGKTITGEQNTEEEFSNLTLTDAQGHSYFIPGKATLSIQRLSQSTPLDHGKKDKSGDFASARILHGTNPDNTSYLYYIKINGGSSGAQSLKENSTKLFSIVQQDKIAHIVRYEKTKSTAYALLQAESITNDTLIKSTNVPCIATSKVLNSNTVNLSVQNPELGKIADTISYGRISQNWHLKSTVQPVELTLKGNWNVSEGEDVFEVSNENNETTIRFNCFDGKPIKVELQKK